MNKASSKFVDKIAAEKLLSEKLTRVHHKPDETWKTFDTQLTDVASVDGELQNLQISENDNAQLINFDSAVQTGYHEDDRVICLYFPAKKVKGEVIFVHGLYEDNRDIYSFMISQLNANGLNVYAMTLPFHYERQPENSRFSGEFFFSGDAYRNTVAFKQAVTDVTQFYHHLKKNSRYPVCLTGFSMGGGVCLTIAGLIPVDRVFVFNPVCNIADLIWTSMLFEPVKNDLTAAGFDQQDIAELYGEFEPLGFDSPATSIDRVVLGWGLYDQINDPKNYDLLKKTWRLEHAIAYKSGHLNILRVPKLAQDIARFIETGNLK